MSEPRRLKVVLETSEDGESDVVQVVGVYAVDEPVPALRDGWTRTVVGVFEGARMNAPAFRFHPRKVRR